jgi:hypothetical protein
MACQCGHHEKTHFGLTGLCGAADGCPCNKFVEAKPVPASPTRFAEMTGGELMREAVKRGADWGESFAALRDAILAERASEVIGMRDTIDALRTRTERAEQELELVRKMELASDQIALEEMRKVGDLTTRLRTAESALGEAKREGAREALTRLSREWSETSYFRMCDIVEHHRDTRYPATPSREGVKWCGYCAKDRMPNTPCVCATPQPSEPLFVPLGVDAADRSTAGITITAPLARRLLALAQTTPEGR